MHILLRVAWVSFLAACGSGGIAPEKGDSRHAKIDDAIAAAASRDGVRARCDQHDAHACWTMAKLGLYSWRLEPDPARLLADLYAACVGGVGTACGFRVDLDPAEKGNAELRARGVGLDAQGCKNGNGEACQWFGTSQVLGEAGAPDREGGIATMTRGCELGYAPSCTQIGSGYEHGWFGERDVDAAAPWYARGCEAGDAVGCYYIGNLAAAGRGMARDPELGNRRRDEACEAGVPEACTRRSLDYWRSGDLEKSRALAQRACRSELPEGCAALALHDIARGTMSDERDTQLQNVCIAGGTFAGEICLAAAMAYGPKDDGVHHPFAYALKACEHGHAPACRHISEHLLDDSPEDKRETHRLFFLDTACAGGDDEAACAEVDEACVAGNAACPSLLPEWGADQRAACAKGDLEACAYVAYLIRETRAMFMMLQMNGAGRDAEQGVVEREANRLLMRIERVGSTACKGGDAHACLTLAGIYRQGLLPPTLRVDPDAERAALERACELGAFEGCFALGSDTAKTRGAELAQKACGKRDAAGCLAVAELAKDEASKKKLTQKACERGSAAACNQVGDPARACTLGDAEACAEQARGALEGAKDEPAKTKARAALEALCDKGNRDACGHAWQMLPEDEQDQANGARLKKRGCQAGHLSSCMTLGF